jgi:cbb3-type cytochrome oxidase maturation protein
MDNYIVAMMLGASIFLGGIALIAFLWAVRNGQFDDQEKFLNATKFDNVEDLHDAVQQQEKKEQLKKRKKEGYRPE